MLKKKRNTNAIQQPSDVEHVKLKQRPLFHPPQKQEFPTFGSPPPPLLQRLQFNQHLNARITFSLELYHKNVIKKLPGIGKSHVIRLTKNVCQT
ncbi:uncharacterized protein [Drosophila bipectinata]|uniref:uncharacterized protein n=1 Tax=Drosophila bipectinata TaxID=42026 RepID=UPI001C89C21B|nr:uncharacterized protein LOC108129257 [Drosophila bipectinata]KAH8236809.1 hypothetical protein KR026_011297 [Drosophila bipectinata]